MKSLEERLADKAKLLERNKRKRSVRRIQTFNVKFPKLEPHVEGDFIYIKERATEIVNFLEGKCPHELFKELSRLFACKHYRIKKLYRAIDKWREQMNMTDIVLPMAPRRQRSRLMVHYNPHTRTRLTRNT